MNVVHASAARGVAETTKNSGIKGIAGTRRRSTVLRIAVSADLPARRAAERPARRRSTRLRLARLRGGSVAPPDGGIGSVLSHQGGARDPGEARAAGPQPVLVHLPRLPGRRRRLAVRGRRGGAVRGRRI